MSKSSRNLCLTGLSKLFTCWTVFIIDTFSSAPSPFHYDHDSSLTTHFWCTEFHHSLNDSFWLCKSLKCLWVSLFLLLNEFYFLFAAQTCLKVDKFGNFIYFVCFLRSFDPRHLKLCCFSFSLWLCSAPIAYFSILRLYHSLNDSSWLRKSLKCLCMSTGFVFWWVLFLV
jgi:hypothetical protein